MLGYHADLKLKTQIQNGYAERLHARVFRSSPARQLQEYLDLAVGYPSRI